jgi:two-component system, OmpR family, response regulator ChvI
MPSKKRILLIDEDPNASYILSMILKLNDFDVIPYTDPDQALAEFRRNIYNLIILEARISKINGFELYQEMRKIDPDAKICFMTNHRQQYMQEFKKLFPGLTADNLVEKPTSTSDVLKIIQRHLGN